MGSEGTAGAVPGEIEVGYLEKWVLGIAQTPQGLVTAPRPPELQEHLDTRREAQGGTAGAVLWGLNAPPNSGFQSHNK